MDILKIIQAGGHLASVTMACMLTYGGATILPVIIDIKERMAVLEATLNLMQKGVLQ